MTIDQGTNPFVVLKPGPSAGGGSFSAAAVDQAAEAEMLAQPFVAAALKRGERYFPVVEAQLRREDRRGGTKARWGIGRMEYRVRPGLYALHQPDAHSPVLVTANYKLTFDRLRRELSGLDAWILVLDTDGINVWCAAGKGSFGTDELADRIAATGLAEVVDHRRLILPQLGGPGVAGHQIKNRTGFEVKWGPIRAEDLPRYLKNGLTADPDMRRSKFTLVDRAALIPVELTHVVKHLAWLLPTVTLAGGLIGRGDFWTALVSSGLFAALAVGLGVIGGVILTALLLPWLPGRAFAIKGAAAGLILIAVAVLIRGGLDQSRYALAGLGWLLAAGALASFLGMNFTGSSTYTSLSGVKKEMRRAVPLQIAAGLAGLGLWVGSAFTV